MPGGSRRARILVEGRLAGKREREARPLASRSRGRCATSGGYGVYWMKSVTLTHLFWRACWK